MGDKPFLVGDRCAFDKPFLVGDTILVNSKVNVSLPTWVIDYLLEFLFDRLVCNLF